MKDIGTQKHLQPESARNYYFHSVVENLTPREERLKALRTRMAAEDQCQIRIRKERTSSASRRINTGKASGNQSYV